MKNIFLLIIAVLLGSGLYAQGEIQDESAERNQYGKAVTDRKTLLPEVRDGILVMQSADKSYKFWFDIRVQTDANYFFDAPHSKGFNELGDGYSLRRARFAAKADLTKNWYGEIDLNFANGVFELEDAYLMFHTGGFLIRGGNFKETFSMSETSSSRYIPFMERSMAVAAFAPGRQIGFNAQYSSRYLLGSLGVSFQAIEDAETRTFVEDNNKDFGMDENGAYYGKLVFQPFNNADYGLHLAGAYSWRNPKTSEETRGTIRYSTRSLSNINRKKFLDTDNIGDYDHNQLSNAEVAVWYKPLVITGEYLTNTVSRTNGREDLNFGGFYIQGNCLLFGGRQIYVKSEGEFTQPDLGRKWGDIELTFRYDYINMNSKDITGGAAEGYTAGLNFYLNKNVKFQLNYSYINHDRYANGKGSLVTGLDANGQPTRNPANVAAPKGEGGHDYSLLGLRFEVDF
ncbi:MAG: OprO/OprP family phosphate-selective porin [Dysgonamonadaceae bacterium]|jgi:phosphate-selective porin OprO/OprP|nr:OprO/OprP family phosphate-selective porin [Dysgonamonadaceae bacterium]